MGAAVIEVPGLFVVGNATLSNVQLAMQRGIVAQALQEVLILMTDRRERSPPRLSDTGPSRRLAGKPITGSVGVVLQVASAAGRSWL